MSLYRLWNVSVYFLFLYAFYFLLFFNAGVLDLLMRVIFVSLCNNIHFSISVTFYFHPESPSVVRLFCVGFFRLSICFQCCKNSLGFPWHYLTTWNQIRSKYRCYNNIKHYIFKGLFIEIEFWIRTTLWTLTRDGFRSTKSNDVSVYFFPRFLSLFY